MLHNRKHIAYLDSIRGLAALTVISEHFVIAYGLPCENSICRQILDYSPFNIWWDGGAAVSMFFVLSGMVLSLKYYRIGHKPDLSHFNLIHYLISRLFRIWLPYLVVLLISAGLYLQTIHSPMLKTHLAPSDWIVDMWYKHPLTVMDMVREGFLLKLPSMVVLLPQAWTLTIELVLSLLLPVGLILSERGAVWLVFFSVLMVSLLGVSIFLLHFLMGLMIARHYSAIAEYLSRHAWQRRLLLLIGLSLYTSGSLFHEQINEAVIWLTSGLGAGLILIYVAGSIRTQAVLATASLHQIGKVSYSAYLIHMAILICLTPHLLKGLEYLSTDRLLLWLGGWSMTIVIVLLFSLVSYHWLETPSMAASRRIMAAFRREDVSAG